MNKLCRALKDRDVLFLLQGSLARVIYLVDKQVTCLLFTKHLQP